MKNMQYIITLPQALPQMTVKELLEEQFLIPRKVRHFLRTRKQVLVNGQSINWQSPVRPGDQIILTFDPADYPVKDLPLGQADLVQELYQDQHLIIVNKPEGMKTHGNEPTEIALLNHVSAYVGTPCYVVHRLDKETSGAILFAKNPFVLPILNRLLERKDIRREYWALAQGSFPKQLQTYRDRIGRDRHDRRKRRVDPKNGQPALTRISRLKALAGASLVNCQLETGRTHQIRVHLAHHGHPILGDPLYHPQPQGRLMLHAHRLTLIHPFTLEEIKVEARSDSFEQTLKLWKN